MLLITCIDKEFGLGKNGRLPWHVKEDLNIFRQNTLDKTILLGGKTAEKLPFLRERDIKVLSRNKRGKTILGSNQIEYVNEFEIEPDWIICGGGEIYSFFLQKNLVSVAIVGRLNSSYDCDTFFPYELLQQKLELSGTSNVTQEYRLEIWVR